MTGTGKYLPVFMMVTATMLVTGCATMTAEECMVADWYRLGQQDAMAGRTTSYLGNRAGDCTEAGHPVDEVAWYAGYERGLEHYCTIDNGFRQGVEGQRYNRICPPELEAAFLDGYDLGASIHRLQGQVNSLRQELDTVTGELRKLEREDRPDRAAIADLRDQRADIRSRLTASEIELATVRGIAQGRGFPVPR